MKVKDLHPRSAISVGVEETVRAAAKHLADDEIGALVVYGPRGPAGIISERDITRAVADGVDIDVLPVEDYMTDAPVMVQLDAALGDAIAKMNDFGVRHLIVVVDGDDVVGMVSMRDIFALLGTGWPEL